MIMEGLGGYPLREGGGTFRGDWQRTDPLNDIRTAAAQDLYGAL